MDAGVGSEVGVTSPLSLAGKREINYVLGIIMFKHKCGGASTEAEKGAEKGKGRSIQRRKF